MKNFFFTLVLLLLSTSLSLATPISPTSVSPPFSDTTFSVTMTVNNSSLEWQLYWTDWHISIWDSDWPGSDDLLFDDNGYWPSIIIIGKGGSATRTLNFVIPAASLAAAGQDESILSPALEVYALFTPSGYLDKNGNAKEDPGEAIVPEPSTFLTFGAGLVGIVLLLRRSKKQNQGRSYSCI